MNYAICVRPANGFCGIRYSQVTTDPFSFTVSGDAILSEDNCSIRFPALKKEEVLYDPFLVMKLLYSPNNMGKSL